jgi:MFS transporter, MFS domain-containing protein family, molybdate-anion transporter
MKSQSSRADQEKHTTFIRSSSLQYVMCVIVTVAVQHQQQIDHHRTKPRQQTTTDIMSSELGQRYWVSFVVCGILCVLLQVLSRNSSPKGGTGNKSPQFASFQFNYLIVFLLAMFSDWLQGPYVYELYVSYGFNQQQIAELFVCGFGSSMLVGTFIGSLADKWGRKLMCMIYCLCYLLACLTKLIPNYTILMFGRFLSGIATSLLFSVFESWMVCEHNKQGYDSYYLSETFSYTTLGNGLVAVCAGLTANTVADSYGYVAPFIVAMLPLSIVGLMIFGTWNENYGNNNLSDFSSLVRGFELVKNDSRIAALGLAQSSFEGAMYTFVFMWTPALKSITETEAELNGVKLTDSTSEHLGLIFAVFMVCVMVGSSFFKILAAKRDMLYRIPLILHALAFFAMGSTALFLENKVIVYAMFLLFEMTVGLFYPAYGVIKSEKIPEEIRSAVMNIFR